VAEQTLPKFQTWIRFQSLAPRATYDDLIVLAPPGESVAHVELHKMSGSFLKSERVALKLVPTLEVPGKKDWDDGTRTRDLRRDRQEDILVDNEALPS
jgi:hypothetical protein